MDFTKNLSNLNIEDPDGSNVEKTEVTRDDLKKKKTSLNVC